MDPIGILIIDDDETSQTALRYVLDSEGWKLRVVPMAQQALAELASGPWRLVIANLALTGMTGPLFTTLKELALAAAVEAGKARARVLFLVPELAGTGVQTTLERQRLPYTVKPLHLHDFLQKVSDLLLETDAIHEPIRRIHFEPKSPDRRRKERHSGEQGRQTSMFAARDEYIMSEEEIAEYEKQEAATKKKQGKQPSGDVPF